MLRRALGGRGFLILLAISIFVPAQTMADDSRILPLKHRSAQEIIPLIRPLLGPDDVLTGMDYRLIVRTSDKKFKEIERLLTQLDVAPQQLRITVQQGVAENDTNTSQSVSGEVDVGKNAHIKIPPKPSDKRGVVIQNDKLRYNAQQRTNVSNSQNTQMLLTQDGRRAYIRIGKLVPHVKRVIELHQNRLILTEGVEMQDVTTGFDVLPRIHGDRVQLEITPRLSTLVNPSTGLANIQTLTTSVEVKRGEWIELGSIFGNRDDIQRAILESARTESGTQSTVRIKVE
ncbi:MAG: hypothetical protein HY081_10745 [Gammaproteobacteria bacterium]|nr:hypothetical protein [Gammaproteobacteria bacterium]